MSADYQGGVLTMTLQDAVKATGVSYTVLYEAVRSGALPALQPRRKYLVTPTDLMSWMRSESEKRDDT